MTWELDSDNELTLSGRKRGTRYTQRDNEAHADMTRKVGGSYLVDKKGSSVDENRWSPRHHKHAATQNSWITTKKNHLLMSKTNKITDHDGRRGGGGGGNFGWLDGWMAKRYVGVHSVRIPPSSCDLAFVLMHADSLCAPMGNPFGLIAAVL